MDRRNFSIKLGAGVAVGAALAGCGKKRPGANTGGSNTGGLTKTYRWRLSMIVPKTLPIWGPGIVQFAEDVRVMSQGRLDIRVYGAGELFPALEVFDRVRSGQVQMGHSAAYYWQGKIPSSVFFTSVPFGMNANGMMSWFQSGGGQQLWDKLYNPIGLKALPCGNTGVQMGGWFNKEMKTLEDFKGLKMRMPGLGGKVIAKAGAQPILLPGGEILTSLQTGVIDATEWVGPYHDYVMGFPKAAKYYYSGGWHEPGSVLELLINKEAWEELTPDLQGIVEAAAAKTNMNMYCQWMAKDSEYYQKILDEGKTEMKEYPISVVKQMKKFAVELMGDIAKTSDLAKEIHDSYLSFQAQYEAYQEVSERAYVRNQKA